MKFHRIVLDEAQAIKNHLSKTCEAVCNLQGKHKWAISGTPIQNRLEEFYSYFRFLELEHTGSFELFKKNFCKRGSHMALQRLQVYLSKYMCRRTHVSRLFGAPILQLPACKPLETIEVEFNSVERAIFQIVRTRFLARLRALDTKEAGSNNYRGVFVLLLRLRMLVSSPLLCQTVLKTLLEACDIERLWELTAEEDEEGRADGSSDTLQVLHQALATLTPDDPSMNTSSRRASSGSNESGILPSHTDQEQASLGPLATKFRRYILSLRETGKWEDANTRSLCSACEGPPEKPLITTCMHIYCSKCLSELHCAAARKDQDIVTCVECGAQVHRSEAYQPRGFDEAGRIIEAANGRSSNRSKKRTSNDDDEDIDWLKLAGPILQSAKTKGVVKKLEEWWKADRTAKFLIFVQFRGMIKIFRRICAEKGWGHTYFNGEMSFDARDMAIKKFTEDPDIKVMIAGMKAGGVGLNLVAANRCVVYDLWWNACMEEQAICRMLRIGQTRECEVVRFVVKGTVDEAIIKMQERKTKEIESAMDEKHRPKKLTTRELLKLFGPIIEGDDRGDGEDEGFTCVDDPFVNANDDSDVEMNGPAAS
jgi:SNF2 family DNA or RNA helicase